MKITTATIVLAASLQSFLTQSIAQTLATNLTILAPHDTGQVQGYFPLGNSFDNPPTWQDNQPQSDDYGWDAPNYSNRIGYIDFGEHYYQYQINAIWTKYRKWSGGNHQGYSNLWWDNDTDSINDGIDATNINFGHINNLAHVGQDQWQPNMQLGANNYISPKARYLIVSTPDDYQTRAQEYAMVGYLDPNATPPPSLDVQTPILTLKQPQVFDYEQLELIDEITFGPSTTDTDTNSSINSPINSRSNSRSNSSTNSNERLFAESEIGISQIETIYGQQCRTLPNVGENGKYFAYKLATQGQLEQQRHSDYHDQQSYILVIDYPQDVARAMAIVNHGDESSRGFYTNTAVGDALYSAYEKPTAESMHFGLSGKIEQWQQLFYLNDKFSDLGAKPKAAGQRTEPVKDGFWVAISQFAAKDSPISQGAAVCRIALYKAPKLADYQQTLTLPPAPLPQRQLFVREEMSDGLVSSNKLDERGIIDPINFYGAKARTLSYLGLNGYSQDLLEFGRNQGWDVGPFTPTGQQWYVHSQYPHRYEQVLSHLKDSNLDLNLIPYYEFSGGNGADGLGRQKASKPLYRENNYTKSSWTEDTNIDVSDPQALIDAKKLLDATIIPLHKNMRPIPKPIGSSYGLGGEWREGWGYLDFGENYELWRIAQIWTRSRLWHGGPATPYQQAFWYNGDINKVNIDDAEQYQQETDINLGTQTQSHLSFAWSKDQQFTSGFEPKGRYLVMKSASSFTDIYEALFIGFHNSEPNKLTTMPMTGGSIDSNHDMQYLFDNPPQFNAHSPFKVPAIWWRPRTSAMPYGFGEDTLNRFSADLGQTVTKTQLQQDDSLLAQYYDWWRIQRKNFLTRLQQHIIDNLGVLPHNQTNGTKLLFTSDASECGAQYPYDTIRVISDELADWQHTSTPVQAFNQAIDSQRHLQAQLQPHSNWGGYEYQHAIPRSDPANYKQGNNGVIHTYTVNDLYTVSDSQSLNAFNTEHGSSAIYHYCLNEDAMNITQSDGSKQQLLGYFVADFERAGPYATIVEARALANGNPYYFGYLASNRYNSGFPGYVRAFNSNYLALPALPMTNEDWRTDYNNIAIRRIETANADYIAVINTSLKEIKNLKIDLTTGLSTNHPSYAINGQTTQLEEGSITENLYPGQLITFIIKK